MPGTDQHVYQLGCDPVVTLTIVEDEGSLVFILDGADDTTDIDGFFFNLKDDSVSPTLRIFPKVDDPNGDVIDFRAEPGILNQLDNGAQTQEQFDVEVQFGEFPGSNAGTVNDTGFTIWVDAGRPLTIDDIDLTKLVAVVDSDNGMGMALIGGEGSGAPVTETVIDVDFQLDNGTNILGSPLLESGIAQADGWFAQGGSVGASGAGDGVLRLDAIALTGAVALSFDIHSVNAQNFEASGQYGDSLRVEVQLDDGSWVLLDEFVVDEHTDTFTGSLTGQTFGDGAASTMSYSGGILDQIDGEVSFRLVADISAANEILRVDNIAVTTTTGGASQTPVVIGAENFDGLHDPEDSDLVRADGDWEVWDDALHTDGANDGRLVFEELPADGPVEFSIDAQGINLQKFEASGRYEDTVRIEVQIDGGDWVLLDEFRVNDAGDALVGSETGQQITDTKATLDYAGGVLDTAQTDVQFRIVSDISASDEQVRFDNVEIRMIEDAAEECEGFDGAQSGDVVSDQFAGVTVSAQRAGDAADSENDAMIFDTANPTGGDHDLSYAGKGNVIIISEDNDSGDADDNAHGGTISFDFDVVSTVSSLTVLDVEEAGGSIDLFDVDGELINSVAIPAGTDNGEAVIDINTDGVASMDVNLVGSGAVDDLCYTPQEEGVFCDQYLVEYDELILPKIDADPALDTTETDMGDDLLMV
ncbi:hypothetical protein [Pseudaestuariivita atlantica]|nr:hypothetical protein [Pseudaestuariivita atlantica]